MNIGLILFIFSVLSLLAVRVGFYFYDSYQMSLTSSAVSELSELNTRKIPLDSHFRHHFDKLLSPSGVSIRIVMSSLISLLVLGACLYIILLDSYPDSTEKWAFGAIGTILGYWLKS